MNDHPVTPATTPPPEPGDLQRLYGDRWDIQLEDLGVWSAVRKSQSGHHVRVLIARTPGELLDKLRTADVVEP